MNAYRKEREFRDAETMDPFSLEPKSPYAPRDRQGSRSLMSPREEEATTPGPIFTLLRESNTPRPQNRRGRAQERRSPSIQSPGGTESRGGNGELSPMELEATTPRFRPDRQITVQGSSWPHHTRAGKRRGPLSNEDPS